MKPSIGRIVHYTLNDDDAARINAARRDGTRYSHPAGCQVHHGNEVKAGEVFPALIVRCNDETSTVNLKVELDGNDCHWATSRCCGEGPGTWAWPKRD